MPSPSPAPPAPRPRSTARSSPVPTASQIISKGGSARAAVPPSRVGSGPTSTPIARRSSVRTSVPPSVSPTPDRSPSRAALVANLKHETEEKESLLLKLQNQEASIALLTTENGNLSSALVSAESRLADLHADQTRMEDEMATRHAVADKLRAQVRELEKEKRDVQRRYNEQTENFDAERQTFYDSEQHLKSRIQNLTQARRASTIAPSVVEESEAEEDEEVPVNPKPFDVASLASSDKEEDHEPAEMTALRLELSTLATSQSSMQNTLQLLQTELLDLKRVNQELQEENESYNILLVERTLTGQYDILRQSASFTGGQVDSSEASSLQETEREGRSSTSVAARSVLDVVSEADEYQPTELERAFAPAARERDASPDSRLGRKSIRRPGSTRTGGSSPGRGETLADLPITGPGLDLAAELGRAEIKDGFEGGLDDPPRPGPLIEQPSPADQALIAENKRLTDANKALSLYASKILDRIISHEGFENVLAVDYSPKVRVTAPPAPAATPTPAPKNRPRSATSSTPGDVGPSTPEPEKAKPAGSRRTMSLDWSKFSIFGGSSSSSTPESKAKAGSPPTARKLDTTEDEEDRKERARLDATMKLMGIEKPTTSDAHLVVSPPPAQFTPPVSPAPTSSIRLPFFSRNRSDSNIPTTPPTNLTTEALEQSEAETSLAALDARERALAEEIGKGRPSGFTELKRGSSSLSERHRRKTSNGSSVASTLWSAGRMSRAGSHENDRERDSDDIHPSPGARLAAAESGGRISR